MRTYTFRDFATGLLAFAALLATGLVFGVKAEVFLLVGWVAGLIAMKD